MRTSGTVWEVCRQLDKETFNLWNLRFEKSMFLDTSHEQSREKSLELPHKAPPLFPPLSSILQTKMLMWKIISFLQQTPLLHHLPPVQIYSPTHLTQQAKLFLPTLLPTTITITYRVSQH